MDVVMDLDTAILMVLTACALGWCFTIRIYETRQYVKECQQKEKKRLKRAERVRQLSGKL